MKNPNEVLRQKEADLARVRHEIDSLRIAAALLADEDSSAEDRDLPSDEPRGKHSTTAEEGTHASGEATGTDGLFSSFSHLRPRRWNVLKRQR
jgi:hypothetical protein